MEQQNAKSFLVALSGNPNVGKSTVFNALTGMHQHTGNWAGKTVCSAKGQYIYRGTDYLLVDTPGTYSLFAQSADERDARDFICFSSSDVAVVVCDATCLERNLILALQVMEVHAKVVLCVNLMDEAKKKKIHVDCDALSACLGVRVVGTSAARGKGLNQLRDAIAAAAEQPERFAHTMPRYPLALEQAVQMIEPFVPSGDWNCRWVALRLLEGDASLIEALPKPLRLAVQQDTLLNDAIAQARKHLAEHNIPADRIQETLSSCIVLLAEEAANQSVTCQQHASCNRDRRIDRFLMGKWTGIPVMLLLLAGIFWITIVGANYPSQLLAAGAQWVEERLAGLFTMWAMPDWAQGILLEGVWRTLGWVVAVMLPPMAIFFPLFTLLEDAGYLPRIAFNLDKQFKRVCACGKQALTHCMGFGCNAVGVISCRIIDSPRERLIAIITNTFAPCNGRFPTLIAMISMFFVGGQGLFSALLLVGFIVLGLMMSFAVSWGLSKTLLKGQPSSFTLELPPYRRPQIGRVVVRSVLDRTLFVLGRAVMVAAPAGLVIWLMANCTVGGVSLLSHGAALLDPFARLIGLDGVILLAFILGFPANEIVMPLIMMGYLSVGSMAEPGSLHGVRQLLEANGWTWLTALCTMLFSLMHFPCSTTCLTIKKETKSGWWTLVSILVPTLCGILVCAAVATVGRLFGA